MSSVITCKDKISSLSNVECHLLSRSYLWRLFLVFSSLQFENIFDKLIFLFSPLCLTFFFIYDSELLTCCFFFYLANATTVTVDIWKMQCVANSTQSNMCVWWYLLSFFKCCKLAATSLLLCLQLVVKLNLILILLG